MEKISVIIPVYNSEKFLKRMLDSLVKQTIFDALEIILINDGSLDKSLQICELYSQKYNNIKVYNQNNRGVSIARNLGLDRATGKYVCFFDSDDELDIRMYEKLRDIIEKNNSDMGIVDYTRVLSDGTKKKKRKKIQKEISGNTKILKCFFKGGMIGNNVCDKIFKREIIEKNKIRFKEHKRIGEDMFFVFEYLKYTKTIYMDFEYSGMKYYENLDSAMNTQFSERFFDTIELSEMMVEEFDTSNEMYYYAEAHKIHEICKVCEYIMIYDYEKKFDKEKNILVKQIKKYNMLNAMKYLTIRQSAGVLLMKYSCKLYLFFYKIMKIG